MLVFKDLKLNLHKYLPWFICVLLIFISIYILNLNTPLVYDDYFYLYITNSDTKINGLLDILHSQIVHYFNINGRFTLHILVQLFLWLGKPLFNIINTFVYIILTFLIYFHCVGLTKKSLAFYIMINILLWFCVPDFGQCILWLTGSINYMWGVVLF